MSCEDFSRLALRSASLSAQGPRLQNQDRCYAHGPWAVVLDGVGGCAHGEQAAATGLASFIAGIAGPWGAQVVDEQGLQTFAAQMNRDVVQLVPEGGAATLTVARVVPSAARKVRVLVGWVGDSPAWVVQPGWARARLAFEVDSASGISSALGLAHWDFRTASIEVSLPARIILATDGLWACPAAERDRLMGELRMDVAQVASELALGAVRGGANDNISLAIIDVSDERHALATEVLDVWD